MVSDPGLGLLTVKYFLRGERYDVSILSSLRKERQIPNLFDYQNHLHHQLQHKTALSSGQYGAQKACDSIVLQPSLIMEIYWVYDNSGLPQFLFILATSFHCYMVLHSQPCLGPTHRLIV